MVNQVGGNDSLVFDGSSVVLNSAGDVIAQGKSFEEDIVYFDSDQLTGEIHEQIAGEEASAYAALVLGTRDYVRKCGFRQVIVGLSGGIDSALPACIAVDALGPENVLGVGMPGPYSSQGSIDDARALAKNLGIRFELLCITEIFEAYRKVLQKVFAGRKEDETEENIQSRARGMMLMALSNKFGAIVLSTGNKDFRQSIWVRPAISHSGQGGHLRSRVVVDLSPSQKPGFGWRSASSAAIDSSP